MSAAGIENFPLPVSSVTGPATAVVAHPLTTASACAVLTAGSVTLLGAATVDPVPNAAVTASAVAFWSTVMPLLAGVRTGVVPW